MMGLTRKMEEGMKRIHRTGNQKPLNGKCCPERGHQREGCGAGVLSLSSWQRTVANTPCQ